MREAIGNSFVINFIITFIIIFMLIFVGTLTYTKAYKVKNKIVDTIEYYDGNVTMAGTILKSDVQSEIEEKLGEMGYRVDNKNNCDINGRFKNGSLISKSSNNYRYCIYRVTTKRGDYYGVVAYAYLQIPIIGTRLEFPVYGETKTFIEI